MGSVAFGCVPLESTVVHFDEWDYQQCASRIQAAAGQGNQKINLLFTLHYRLNAQGQMNGFCFYSDTDRCEPLTDPIAKKFQNYLQVCAGTAARTGVNLGILLQMDDGTGDSQTWRNNLSFDPRAIYSGYSYEQLLVNPIAETLNATLLPGSQVEFSLQGEMGATLGAFPDSWRDLAAATRLRLPRPSSPQVGISLNYGGVFGANLAPAQVNAADVQRLVDESDFIGISAYHEVDLPVTAVQFRASFDRMNEDLARYGVKVPNGKSLHISEIGLGGGAVTGENRPAQSLKEAASAPWAGVVGPYQAALDPWRKPGMASFRARYFRSLMNFLQDPPKDLKVTSAYLWNADSFDVQNLYPYTRGYGDPQVTRDISAHNRNCLSRSYQR